MVILIYSGTTQSSTTLSCPACLDYLFLWKGTVTRGESIIKRAFPGMLTKKQMKFPPMSRLDLLKKMYPAAEILNIHKITLISSDRDGLPGGA